MTEFSIVNAENDFILDHPSFSTHRPGLYPSEASVKYEKDGFTFVDGKCHRAAYYRIKGIPKDRERSVSLNMKASNGKSIEEATIDRWKKMGLWMGNNVKFFIPEFVVSGELDAIIKTPDEKLIGYEIKTYEGHYPAREILGAKKPPKPGQPKPGHFLQSITYAWEYRNSLDEYRIYYADRGGGPRAEFRIGFEEKNGKNICWREQVNNKYWNYFTEDRIYYPYAIEDVHSRFKELANYLRKGQLPPKDYGYLDADMIEYLYTNGELTKKKYEPWKKNPNNNPVLAWQCSYCDYAGRCKQDSIEEETK